MSAEGPFRGASCAPDGGRAAAGAASVGGGLTASDDRSFMARALALAERGLYTTTPNPRVGCVVVKDGSIVGEGWHALSGEAHAEQAALDDARSSAPKY